MNAAKTVVLCLIPHIMKSLKIERILAELNASPYRYRQVLDGMYKQYIKKYADFTILPTELREKLSKELGPTVLTLKNIYETKDGQALKVLFETQGKNRIETVLMDFDSHKSLCVSSQSGCALGCTFCATGAIGFKENLSAGELADQILYFLQEGHTIDSVSFMGMGEPFANPHFFDAIKIITSADMLNFGQRRLSVSTVGIIPGIERLSAEYPQINLAFSLHSPFQSQRLALMPITKAYPIAHVMAVLKRNIQKNNRKIFIAYVLLDGVNDSLDHAKALVGLIKNQKEKMYLYHINVIRFNPSTSFIQYNKTSAEKVAAFRQVLADAGVNNTLRQNFGLKIDAACGQLFGKYAARKRT